MMAWRPAALAVVFTLLSFGVASAQPQGAPMPPPIAGRAMWPYPGVITLDVDATDVQRGIFRAREHIPVRVAGPMTLLLSAMAAGQARTARAKINLFAGLEIANGQVIPWRRDPINIYAFHVDVPEGASGPDLSFQYVSPGEQSGPHPS
ncbi:MAG: hypothetical protein R3C16_10070 [Hyphomonadaceae bacterium]